MTHKKPRITRRTFLNLTLGAGVAVSAGQLLHRWEDEVYAETPAPTKPPAPAKPGWQGPMGVERVAREVPLGYQSPDAPAEDTVRWVQVDLKSVRKIDAVKLFPFGYSLLSSGAADGLPQRFRIDASVEPDFHSPMNIADFTSVDFPESVDEVGAFHASKIDARYIRVTVTRTRRKQFQLSKLEVWSGPTDAAEGCAVSESTRGSLGVIALTRPPRPQGEGVVTDNPGNVIPVAKWKPVADKAHTPTMGVRLEGGVFQTAMEQNIAYLLNTFSANELLRPFRERAGKPIGEVTRQPIGFWDTDLPGSNAGRFLMGAGNTLRWIDHPKLKARMDEIVDGIAECARPDGYLMAYPPESMFYSERGGYTRAWVTHGLIEAGFAGNPKAFKLLRGFYDWFNKCEYLPEMLRRAGQGVQGQIASTRMYFTPVGKPEDLQVAQRYYQENYWMKQLAARDPEAIWKYPYDHPHCYLLTSLEPILDHYRATGAKRYLDAAAGGWDLYHDNWLHVGGTIAICEGPEYPPQSYYLHNATGELCGSVFWAFYSQRFHRLSPGEEKYVAQIEQAIYNVALANQFGSSGICYHANLEGRKDASSANNTCCEGQGTRLLGAIPEFIYSIASNGLYVNLFAPSTITWKQGTSELSLKMATEFPFGSDVVLTITSAAPAKSAIRIRVPGWANAAMPVTVNGKTVATGKPGSYLTINRTWKQDDKVAFTLPIGFKTTLYEGADQLDGADRYALEYGPVLMAAVGPMNEGQSARFSFPATELTRRLQPVSDQPLHYAIEGQPEHRFIPYWQVQQEAFTCYPILGAGSPRVAASPGPDDLALASHGAHATSDSEYANEPGCTEKIIDGAVVIPGDQGHRWHSSLETPHPHWVQVDLPKPTPVGRIVVQFADPAGHPTSFQGIAKVNGKDRILFDVTGYKKRQSYMFTQNPIVIDSFRFVIHASRNPAFPNAAQLSQIELYKS
jgi:DUF1680 family protein